MNNNFGDGEFGQNDTPWTQFGQRDTYDFPFTHPYTEYHELGGVSLGIKKVKKVFFINIDLMSVIFKFQTFTEMLCLKYSCSHFYHIIDEIMRKSFFWKHVDEDLFAQLTSCRHTAAPGLDVKNINAVQCMMKGLSRINLSELEHLEIGEGVRFRNVDAFSELRMRCPKLKTIQMYLSDFPHKETKKNIVEAFKSVRVVFTTDISWNQVIKLRDSPLMMLSKEDLDTNFEKCLDIHDHDGVFDDGGYNECYKLSDRKCSICSKEKCKSFFQYTQMCTQCGKRCCNACYEGKEKLMSYCQSCQQHYCSSCSGLSCSSCNVKVCVNKGCRGLKCIRCDKEVCNNCSIGFCVKYSGWGLLWKETEENKYLIVLCDACCDVQSKKEGGGVRKDTERDNGWTGAKAHFQDMYVGQSRIEKMKRKMPPPRSSFGGSLEEYGGGGGGEWADPGTADWMDDGWGEGNGGDFGTDEGTNQSDPFGFGGGDTEDWGNDAAVDGFGFRVEEEDKKN